MKNIIFTEMPKEKEKNVNEKKIAQNDNTIYKDGDLMTYEK